MSRLDRWIQASRLESGLELAICPRFKLKRQKKLCRSAGFEWNVQQFWWIHSSFQLNDRNRFSTKKLQIVTMPFDWKSEVHSPTLLLPFYVFIMCNSNCRLDFRVAIRDSSNAELLAFSKKQIVRKVIFTFGSFQVRACNVERRFASKLRSPDSQFRNQS